MHAALAREVEQALASVTPPVERGLPLRAVVDVVPGDTGWRYRAYWDRDPQPREHFGPTFEYPRECIAFVDQVNRKTGPKVGDPIVVDGAKFRVRLIWAGGRLDCRTSFGNRWITVAASELEWDDVADVWRKRAAA